MLNRYYLIDVIWGFFGNIDDSDFPLFCQLWDLGCTVVSHLLYAGMNLILSLRYPILVDAWAVKRYADVLTRCFITRQNAELAGEYPAGATPQIAYYGSNILYPGYIIRIVKQLCGFYGISLNRLIFQKLIEFS